MVLPSRLFGLVLRACRVNLRLGKFDVANMSGGKRARQLLHLVKRYTVFHRLSKLRVRNDA